MRRFVFEDKKYEVKVTVDIPEGMFQGIRHTKKDFQEALRKLVMFTIEKETASE
jgi:hypothetical protein